MIRVGALTLTLHLTDARWQAVVPRQCLQRAARGLTALGNLFPSPASAVGICLTNDAFICSLNRIHRARPRPTDVLSFPAMGELNAPGVPGGLALEGGQELGDLVVAFESVRRKARLCGMAPAGYLSFAVIHGILHLLGADHDTAVAAKQMRAREARALAQVQLVHPWP